ncbi:MAG: thioredoxin family protein [Muribaculaceae bacterium]|nr:thioredoxin family protein [Bacteroidales bacterium]MDY4811402.1 thioredoxin family protein [Muribaculaceae bacterium]
MTYDELIRKSPVSLIEFYATWCPHCQAMQPIVDQIKEVVAGKIDVYQLDIDKNGDAAENEEVEATPTFIIYRDGREVWRQSGEMDGEVLLSRLKSFM